MINEELLKSNLAGMVVLYRPDVILFSNIVTYLDHLSHLYIIDNTENPDPIIKQQLLNLSDKISYHPFYENRGIASALNQGCDLATKDGYRWMLTMDQDSHFGNSDFFDLALNKVYYDIIIIAASYNTIHFNARESEHDGFKKVDFVITSGNILNLEAWKLTGRFLDKLFIDEVDNEFCLRAVNRGFKILTTDKIYLFHKLGEGIFVKHIFSGKKYLISKHSPIRIYYTVRNNFFIWKKFVFSNPLFVLNRIRSIGHQLTKIALYFPDKKEYLHAVLKALRDAGKGKYGKLIS